MLYKSYLIEQNFNTLKNNITLFYGENIGLKDEFKIGLKKRYYRYEQILFDQDEIIKNEKLLNDQVNNVSMFNDNKLIFINEISDKILPKIDDIIDDSVNHIKLVLFGQNLDKDICCYTVVLKNYHFFSIMVIPYLHIFRYY